MERYRKFFEESEVTQEMIDWFFKRTNMHIDYVKQFAEKLINNNKFDFMHSTDFLENYKKHDELKFKEPEFTPYIRLSWKHKFDNYKDYKTPGTLDDEEINKATLHHICNSNHHPEFWQDEKENLFNIKDRNGIPGKIIDATRMPIFAIAEMVCDWMAMAKELKTNPKDWADKVINKRWKFNRIQIDLIYKIIYEIWKK